MVELPASLVVLWTLSIFHVLFLSHLRGFLQAIPGAPAIMSACSVVERYADMVTMPGRRQMVNAAMDATSRWLVYVLCGCILR